VGASGGGEAGAPPDAALLLRYLQDVSEQPHMRARSQERLAGSAIAPGQVVADIGCGVGGDTLMLARHVASGAGAPGGGHVTGIDISRTAVDFAAARPDAAGLPVSFRQGDAASLPFRAGELDACWMERVLATVPNPAAMLGEIRRALRTGGQAVLHEFDWRTFVLDAPDREVTELLVARLSSGMANPAVARSLARLCREAGFARVEVVPGLLVMPNLAWAAAVGRWFEHLATLVNRRMVDEDRAAAWYDSVREADEAGAMVCTLTSFTVYATR
jgi:ubiquinone/menaquinone biosynthesis C-methylase UbiE